MDKNERKKKMRKGLLIVGIVIAALLVLLLCVYWISQTMVEKVDTYVRLEGIRFAQADYTYNIFDDVLYNAKEREIYYSEYGSTKAPMKATTSRRCFSVSISTA